MQPKTVVAVLPQHIEQDAVFERIKQQVGQRNYEHWFENKTTLSLSDDELRIGVASPFLLNWMQKKFRTPANKVAQSVLGPSAHACFEVDNHISLLANAEHENTSNTESVEVEQPLSPSPKKGRKSDITKKPGRRFLDLSDFVPGPCNELAFMAAGQACEEPGNRFNPLYIYGNVGTGKTHLLEGIYRKIRRQYPSLQVMFLTSEAFTNYFTQALRDHTLPAFRQKFRSVDVFLVDDVDFFNSKRVIQEEFLHTFKQLESHGRQIVLTADCHPRLLTKMNEELTTRFVSGLVCRVESPDLETRKKIVRKKTDRMSAEFTPESLNFVAERFHNNVRELEGALNCLQTYYDMTKKRVGVTVTRKILADLERDCIRIVGLSEIEQAVCKFFGVDAKDIKSSKRSRTVSQPRMLAMFLARKHTRSAYSEIGEYFGGRNHSTVMSAEKAVRKWMTDQTSLKIASQSCSFDEVLESLEQQLLTG